VEVLTVAASDIAVEVNGRGEVSPKTMVNVVPQVGGVIVEIHRSLAAGGFVQAGELLVRIDPRDYELAVARAEAAVARAQTSVDRETAEADIARGEWYAMHPDTDPPSGLVVREPQIRQAQAELVAAEADLATAQLALDRTRITAPFDAVVASEHIDLGQYVPAGQSLALLYGTEAVEIRVPLQDQELAWFEVPRRTDAPGPAAMVRSHFAGADQEWHGRVTRLEADVDSRSRMVRVVVEVGDPFDASAGRPPLLPGTFVDVGIAGRTLEDVIAIPRYALRDGDIVWVADNGRLQRRGVIVVRREPSVVLVSGGLQSGESLILTSISAVTDGMKIRTRPAAVEGTGMLADVQPGGESS
jgi:RND family efflux transporter MFP subunit